MKVFVSYRRKSWPIVRHLAIELGKRLEAIVFVDLTSIDEADFEKSILRNLREADAFILIVSEYTFASERIHDPNDWVRREVREALRLKKPTILVLLDGILPPEDIPEDIRAIRRMQGIKFYPEYFDEAVTDLATFISKITPIRLRYDEAQLDPTFAMAPITHPNHPTMTTMTQATLRRMSPPTVPGRHASAKPQRGRRVGRHPLLVLALSVFTAVGILGSLAVVFLSMLGSRAATNVAAQSQPTTFTAFADSSEMRPAEPEITEPASAMRIVYEQMVDGNNEIFSATVTGQDAIRLTFDASNDMQPDLSPDGQRILFVSDRDGDDEIYVMAIDGSGFQQLTFNHIDDCAPDWSPDGLRIAYSSETTGTHQVYVMNANGSAVRRITGNYGGSFEPVWSPDGKRLAFHSLRTGNAEIFTINPDGLNQVQLTNHRAEDTYPDWSPDGQYIAFSSDRDGKHEIYVMRSNGSGARKLTDDDRLNDRPVWTPDGQHIVYECEGDALHRCVIRRSGNDWYSLSLRGH